MRYFALLYNDGKAECIEATEVTINDGGWLVLRREDGKIIALPPSFAGILTEISEQDYEAGREHEAN